MTTVLIDYDSGNLHSAEKAFQRMAAEGGHGRVVVTADPDAVARADRIVLPGDGAFPACRRGLQAIDGLEEAIVEAVETRGVPFLGICLGMQVAVIEFARNVAGLEAANSTEFDPYTPHPVIDLMPEQLEVDGMGGTMRLGSWPMQVRPGTRIAALYAGRLDGAGGDGAGVVLERHRHRYEVNPGYVERLTDAGLVVSGVTPGMAGRGAGLVEAVEVPDHPFCVGLQSHPEFTSRLMRPSPPFTGFIHAAVERRRAASAAG
jgi:CTP synthase